MHPEPAVAPARGSRASWLAPVGLLGDVDPVLVGMIAVLLLIVFALYLFVRRTLKSFTSGLRDGQQ